MGGRMVGRLSSWLLFSQEDMRVMTAWYVSDGGLRWRLCQIVARGIGYVTVLLYDGTKAKGVAHRGKWSELVKAV